MSLRVELRPVVAVLDCEKIPYALHRACSVNNQIYGLRLCNKSVSIKWNAVGGMYLVRVLTDCPVHELQNVYASFISCVFPDRKCIWWQFGPEQLNMLLATVREISKKK